MSSPADAVPSVPAGKFEDLLGRLEQIVADMEAAELPLEKLLSSYEEGMRLVKACGDRLAHAEQKIEILSKGEPASGASPTPAAVGARLAESDTALAPAKAEDEIRLI